MELTITNNVFKRISELAHTKKNALSILRISVDGGGCNGYMYKYELVDDTDLALDDYIEEKDNVRVAIDSVSAKFISGCIVDFVEELGSSYFEIKNPKAIAKCGCGNSFSI